MWNSPASKQVGLMEYITQVTDSGFTRLCET